MVGCLLLLGTNKSPGVEMDVQFYFLFTFFYCSEGIHFFGSELLSQLLFLFTSTPPWLLKSTRSGLSPDFNLTQSVRLPLAS